MRAIFRYFNPFSRSKDDKIGSLLSELENANDKVKILEAENEKISTNMKALEVSN